MSANLSVHLFVLPVFSCWVNGTKVLLPVVFLVSQEKLGLRPDSSAIVGLHCFQSVERQPSANVVTAGADLRVASIGTGSGALFLASVPEQGPRFPPDWIVPQVAAIERFVAEIVMPVADRHFKPVTTPDNHRVACPAGGAH